MARSGLHLANLLRFRRSRSGPTSVITSRRHLKQQTLTPQAEKTAGRAPIAERSLLDVTAPAVGRPQVARTDWAVTDLQDELEYTDPELIALLQALTEHPGVPKPAVGHEVDGAAVEFTWLRPNGEPGVAIARRGGGPGRSRQQRMEHHRSAGRRGARRTSRPTASKNSPERRDNAWPTWTFTKTKQKLEPAVGAKVYAFLHKLTQDDAANGLRIKKISHTADPRVRTGRVDDNYRAVLFQLSGTNDRHFVYAGTWPHDEAISRAQRMTMRLNDVNGVAEFYQAAPEAQPAQAPDALDPSTASHSETPTFQPKYVNNLVRLGYSTDPISSNSSESTAQWPNVLLRAGNEAQFSAAADRCSRPGRASHCWTSMPARASTRSRRSWDSYRRSLTTTSCLVRWPRGRRRLPRQRGLHPSRRPGPEHTEADNVAPGSDDELIKALHHPASRMQFIPLEGVAGVEELRDVIEQGTFEDWTVFLHPEQRRFATRRNKNSFRVSGGAGTGKTVVAIHRARNLARRDPSATAHPHHLHQDFGAFARRTADKPRCRSTSRREHRRPWCQRARHRLPRQSSDAYARRR